MQRFIARQTVRLVVGVLGAVLVAAAISAAGEAYARNLPGYLSAFSVHLLQFARLDFGVSAVSATPALQELAQNLPLTLILVGMGFGVSLVAGVPFGLLLALRPARKIAAPLIQVITATPVFCSGLALAYIAVHAVHWPVSVNAPVGAIVPPDQFWQITALPVFTVGLAGAAAVQLALRRSTMQSSGESFRTGLKRMGLGLVEIEALYVLPQVVAGLLFGAREIVLTLLSAAVVAEWVFHRTGAADLFVKSVALADWNMAAILLFVFATVTFSVDFVGKVIGHALAPGERV
jgi:peptide/nickel transport system permease protein